MKGFTKAMKRTPYMMTSKVGMAKKSTDPEFEDYGRNFAILETATEKFIKDSKTFSDAVISLFTAGAGFGVHFSALFHPIAGEFDLIGKHPTAALTVQNIDAYESAMEELRAAIAPELELIESRIMSPLRELQGVMKTIRKTITKREHKLTDYDRFNNSLTKLRDKKEKTLTDEKNLFKLEQDFEIATTEYDYINNALKTDLPRFMTLSTQFIDPLFHSFFYMQLNIYYVLLEKMNSFAEGKYETTNVPGQQIQADYEEKRTDAWQYIEEFTIVKRIVSMSRLVQQSRAASLAEGGSVGRSPSIMSSSSSLKPPLVPPPFKSAAPPTRSPSSVSATYGKKAPPPPPEPVAAPPPPYSGGAASTLAATKRAPPPPPPLKPKPKPAAPAAEYVVALYDFDAQADGDLSFVTGERIEIVQKTASAEDWWTGKVDGRQGVFPGNYVQET